MSAATENENLARLTREIAEAKHEREDEAERHTAADKEIFDRQKSLEAERRHALAGTGDEELRIAREMLEVDGDVVRAPMSVITDAVEDIAAGCLALRREYLAVKDYASYTNQRCDCRYGSAPKHGTVVFSIGLTAEARGQIERWGKILGGVDGEATQAMIRYLLNLEEAGVA